MALESSTREHSCNASPEARMTALARALSACLALLLVLGQCRGQIIDAGLQQTVSEAAKVCGEQASFSCQSFLPQSAGWGAHPGHIGALAAILGSRQRRQWLAGFGHWVGAGWQPRLLLILCTQ